MDEYTERTRQSRIESARRMREAKAAKRQLIQELVDEELELERLCNEPAK